MRTEIYTMYKYITVRKTTEPTDSEIKKKNIPKLVPFHAQSAAAPYNWDEKHY